MKSFRASLEKRPDEVADMFNQVAPKYDRTNTVLSLGLDRYWRKEMVQALTVPPAANVLDLAAGTGVSTRALLAAGYSALAADFSLGMLQASPVANLDRVVADAYKLPFKTDSFSAVTISFGLRNMANLELVLAEISRVLNPDGQLVICEFSTPTQNLFAKIYKEYLLKWLPRVADKVASNPLAYTYLAESILDWPNQRALAEKLIAAGWQDVKWRNLTGGIVAIHSARKG